MKIIEKDITTVTSGTIVHQVNCKGVMGSGVAKTIRNQWPVVFSEYKKFIKNNLSPLGHLNFVKIDPDLYVVNLFGQLDYNKPGIEFKTHTDYGAWSSAMARLQIQRNKLPNPIYFPYMVGCDRGGGDWIKISGIIEMFIPDVIYCKWS